MHPDHELNRVSWDQLAAVHGQDSYYDSAALVAGASSLIEEEEAALLDALGGAVSGRSILHLQCHLGFDAITFARRGASATGVDFSTVALARASDLADRCGVQVEWILADATALPACLNGRFDLVWATVGVLCWISDVRSWMRAAAGVLADGGRLVLIDGYPSSRALKFDSAGHAHGRPARRFVESGWDYATTARTGPQVQFNHSLEEIVSAVGQAGLRVTRLHAHTDISCDLRIDRLTCESDGRFRLRLDGQPLPVLFTLIAGHADHTVGTTIQGVPV